MQIKNVFLEGESPQLFSGGMCEIFKNTYFEGYLCERLLLNNINIALIHTTGIFLNNPNAQKQSSEGIL